MVTVGAGEVVGSHLSSIKTIGAGADGMLPWSLVLAVRPVGEMGEYLPGVLSRSRFAGWPFQMEYCS